MVTLTAYKRGVAPVQLINHTKHYMIEYSEKDNQVRSRNLSLPSYSPM
jgi:hypothetical protein